MLPGLGPGLASLRAAGEQRANSLHACEHTKDAGWMRGYDLLRTRQATERSGGAAGVCDGPGAGGRSSCRVTSAQNKSCAWFWCHLPQWHGAAADSRHVQFKYRAARDKGKHAKHAKHSTKHGAKASSKSKDAKQSKEEKKGERGWTAFSTPAVQAANGVRRAPWRGGTGRQGPGRRARAGDSCAWP